MNEIEKLRKIHSLIQGMIENVNEFIGLGIRLPEIKRKEYVELRMESDETLALMKFLHQTQVDELVEILALLTGACDYGKYSRGSQLVIELM